MEKIDVDAKHFIDSPWLQLYAIAIIFISQVLQMEQAALIVIQSLLH
jgi:hypothetical protein